MIENDRFLRACRREPVDYTPVWMMRQAGRYMAEYRALREKHTLIEICKTPELALQVTQQPLRLGMDAAILFADILLPLEPMGAPFEFAKGEGPVIHKPVRSKADVDALRVIEPHEGLGYVLEAIKLIKKEIKIPLIGFAGAPFTMATYAVEGGGSKDYAKTKAMLFGDPEAAHQLLGKLADTCAVFLEAQVKAGAQAVQIFDSWAGVLSQADFREYALRHARAVIDRLRASPAMSGVPIIYFANGCAPYLADYAQSGADVLGVDWRVDIDVVRKGVGDGVALQGNMDPGALFCPPEEIRRRVHAILGKAGPVGHIFNLGHGVTPETNPEHVKAMIAAVKEYKHGA